MFAYFVQNQSDLNNIRKYLRLAKSVTAKFFTIYYFVLLQNRKTIKSRRFNALIKISTLSRALMLRNQAGVERTVFSASNTTASAILVFHQEGAFSVV